MRILLLNWQDRKHPYAGGAEVHLHEIFSRLGAKGHTITLLCCGFSGAGPEEHYDNMRVIRRGGRLLFNWGIARWVKSLMKKESFDVVVDDINKIPFYSARFTDKPILAVVHHLFGKAIYKEVDPVSASYVHLAEALVPRYYRGVPFMVVSESTRDDLIARGIDSSTIRIVHNGIDSAHYRPDPSVPKSAEPTIVFVGRVKRYKSIDHLLIAHKRLRDEFPSLTLHIVGSGGDESRLKSLAANLDLGSSTIFHGFMTLENKINMLRRAWVVACPSIKEGWGLTNIESNACGAPVVCANVPGLRDSTRDGETGLLYPYGDIEALTDCLRQILSSPELRERLSRGAIEWAGRFSWDNAAMETERILECVIAGKRRIAVEC